MQIQNNLNTYYQYQSKNQAYQPANTNNQSDPDTAVFGEDVGVLSSGGGMVSARLISGFNAKRVGEELLSKSIPEGASAFSRGGRALKQSGLTVGIETAVYTTSSLLKNGYDLYKNNLNHGVAAANVMTDMARGLAAGVGASAGGGTAALFAKAIGCTGAIGSVISICGGIIGSTLADVVDRTDLRGYLIESFA